MCMMYCVFEQTLISHDSIQEKGTAKPINYRTSVKSALNSFRGGIT